MQMWGNIEIMRLVRRTLTDLGRIRIYVVLCTNVGILAMTIKRGLSVCLQMRGQLGTCRTRQINR